MRQTLLLALLLSVTSGAWAQSARVSRHTAPLAGKAVLGDMEDKYNAQVYNLEAPAPDGNADKRRLRLAKEASAGMFPRRENRAAAKTTAAKAPVVAIDFVSDSVSGIPPDNDMAVSMADTGIAVMNSRLSVLDTKSGHIVKRISLRTFSSAAGLNQFEDNKFDPKVIYDRDEDKYICVMLNATNDRNYIIVGFSETNSPQGEWNFYKFYGNFKCDTTWFDYPAISITKEELFLTGNQIKFNSSWQLGFTETVIYQIRKGEGYAGAANITYQIWDSIARNGEKIRNLFPVKTGMGIGGPEQYFLSNRNFDVQNDSIFLVKVPDIISSGNQNLTLQVLKTPLSYGVPPNGRQPDTSVVLATNDGRILGAYAQDGEINFVSTSVDPNTGSAGIYHGIISDYRNNPSITHARIFSVDTLDFGYPNISYAHSPWDKKERIISFNYTGPNTFPGLAAINYDGSGYSDLVKIKEGEGSISVLNGKEQRWGDYTGSQIDYNNYGSVWVVGIYGRKDKRYGNWMAKLNASFVSVKDKQAVQAESTLFPNPAFRDIYFDFDNPADQVLSFAIYDIAGKLVDRMLDQVVNKGKKRIQFDISSLPAGTYYLKATDNSGSVVSVNKFIRN